MNNSYTLTAASVRNINRTINSVNKMKASGAQGNLPFRQNPERQTRGATLKIGKTTGAWTKGLSAKVNLYSTATRTQLFEADGVTPRTAKVYNLFADIEADKWVAFISGYLVSAECDD